MRLVHTLFRQLHYKHSIPKIIIFGIFAFILASCSSNTSQNVLPTLVEFPTDNAAQVTEETSPIVIETDEPGQTPEVVAPNEDAIRHQNDEQTLFILVSTIRTAENTVTMPVASDGEKFIMPAITFGNFTGEAIRLDASSLALIDTASNRYAPITPDDFIPAPILGLELGGTNTTVGSIRFAMPVDAIPHLLEWCPYNDCEIEALQILLP